MKHGARQDTLANFEIVVLAIYALGGEDVPVDLEHIAMKAHELAPGIFSWQHFPDQVSLDKVRRALRVSAEASRGSTPLAGGAISKGWHLTRAGAEWAAAHQAYLAAGLQGRRRADRSTERRRLLERARIEGLPAWSRHQNGEAVTVREAEAVFRLTRYVVGDRRKLLVDRGLALMGGDEQFGNFVDEMAALVESGAAEESEK